MACGMELVECTPPPPFDIIKCGYIIFCNCLRRGYVGKIRYVALCINSTELLPDNIEQLRHININP